MTHRVLVNTFHSAYRNAGMAMKKKYHCSDLSEIIEKIETECNLKSVIDGTGYESNHYFEFPTEQHYTMFALKWS
jgi:hypothetical protein